MLKRKGAIELTKQKQISVYKKQPILQNQITKIQKEGRPRWKQGFFCEWLDAKH